MEGKGGVDVLWLLPLSFGLGSEGASVSFGSHQAAASSGLALAGSANTSSPLSISALEWHRVPGEALDAPGSFTVGSLSAVPLCRN